MRPAVSLIARPTLYEWLDGGEPSAGNADRMDDLLSILAEANVGSHSPLNSRFVRRPILSGAPSLVELLQSEKLNRREILGLIEAARTRSREVGVQRIAREERLRGLGYDDPSADERRDNIARTVASQDWPKR